MITLITGLPGHGKGLFSLSHALELIKKDPRPVFYHNINELKLDWHHLQNGQEWFNCPAGSLILIDEAQKVFRPRSSGSIVPLYVSELETHRHKGHDLIVITQHPQLIDVNLRKLVDRHYHVVRKFGGEKATVHEFIGLNPDPQRTRKDSIRHNFKYPKEIYSLYKSAEVHTVKKSLPLRVYLFYALPVLILIMVYYATTVFNKQSEPETTTQSNVPDQHQQTNTQEQFIPQPQALITRAEYIQQYEPRIEGLAYTASVYDEITKPIEAPYPSACYDFKGSCRCWSQQATEMVLKRDVCLQVIKYGIFKPWLAKQLATVQQTDKPQQK